MSLKKISSFILAGLFVGVGLSYLKNKTQNREIASLTKPEVLGKQQRIIDVKITAVNGTPGDDSKELVLKAEATPLVPIEGDLEYTWVLPEEADVVAGEKSDSWYNVKPGQTASTEISLLNVSKESPKTVVLQVHGIVNGVRMGGAAVFSSQEQNIHLGEKGESKMEAQKKDLQLPGHIQQ